MFCAAGGLLAAVSAGFAAELETEAWQRAIDAASAAGGGIVSVPAGVHRSGTLRLKDGVTLRLEKGAVLKASTNLADYVEMDGPSAFIWAKGASRIAIEGEGEINGSGGDFPCVRELPRPRLVRFDDCRDVRVEDVTLRDSARWTLYLAKVDGFAVRRIRIRAHRNWNNDGIDIKGRNGVVEDCDIDSEDDSIVFKAQEPDYVVENVKVRRCRLSGNTNCIKIGTETFGTFRNIEVSDCEVKLTQPPAVLPYLSRIPGLAPNTRCTKIGIAVEMVDGGTIDGVTIRNITVDQAQTPIFVRLGRRNVQEGRRSALRNVLIENVRAIGVCRIASSVTGVPGCKVEDVTIRNVELTLPGGGTLAECAREVPENEKGYPTNVTFDYHPLPASAFYVRHADRIRFENVSVKFLRPDERPLFAGEDATYDVIGPDAPAFSACGTFESDGCFARWDGTSLTIGNARFERTYRATESGLATSSLKAEKGVELVRPRTASGRLEASCVRGRMSNVGVEGVVATVRCAGTETVLRFWPFTGGPLVTRPKVGDFTALDGEPTDYRAATRWRSKAGAALRADSDTLGLASRHVRVTAMEFADRTDQTNELEWEREWLLNACERDLFLACNALDVRDTLTDEGVVFLRLSPLPASRPVRSPDFIVSGRDYSVTAAANGYPVAELAYRGGEAGRTRALHALQRAVRAYRPGRDGVFLSNTWGDGNRDARINEAFLMEEVAAGAELGVDVIQIDDGWQKGRTANSAAVAKGGGTWGRYWDVDPGFWTPDPVRFPNGLGPVVAAAKAKGMRFGLWFGPDSSDDFRHYKDDAECLLRFHREFGIDYFKMDSMCVLTGVAQERQRRMFDLMLEGSKGAMTFDLDCTANVRPGYFGLVDIGPLFVENRYIRSGDTRLYYPHYTLRNLWRLSRVVDPVRLRMEVLNPLRHSGLYGDDPLRPAAWPADALFAIAMCASPLGWFEISGLSPETVAAMKPLVAAWKRERANVHGGVTHPVGACPDGLSWTGFVTEAAEGGGGYALLFRELDASASFSLDLSPYLRASSCEMLAGGGTAEISGNRLTVTVPGRLGYAWLRLRDGDRVPGVATR